MRAHSSRATCLTLTDYLIYDLSDSVYDVSGWVGLRLDQLKALGKERLKIKTSEPFLALIRLLYRDVTVNQESDSWEVDLLNLRLHHDGPDNVKVGQLGRVAHDNEIGRVLIAIFFRLWLFFLGLVPQVSVEIGPLTGLFLLFVFLGLHCFYDSISVHVD